ncbi:MAG: hypothetical protein KA955_07725 [Prevotella sp.]|nr:hypothetical protein [Prevotella sp.]
MRLGKLSSPMRQLYFFGGLMMTGKESDEHRIEYTDEEWKSYVQRSMTRTDYE